jgi:hypothetical protein
LTKGRDKIKCRKIMRDTTILLGESNGTYSALKVLKGVAAHLSGKGI